MFLLEALFRACPNGFVHFLNLNSDAVCSREDDFILLTVEFLFAILCISAETVARLWALAD